MGQFLSLFRFSKEYIATIIASTYSIASSFIYNLHAWQISSVFQATGKELVTAQNPRSKL